MRMSSLAVLVVVLLTGSAVADDKAIGAGGVSCRTWTSERMRIGGRYSDMANWVVGFLSGVGYKGPEDPLGGLDADAVEGWLDQYCQIYPLNSLADAAKAFVAEHPR